MRPTAIPDHEVWEGAVRSVMAPPLGEDPWDSTIGTVEVLKEIVDGDQPRIHVRFELSDDDVRRIRDGHRTVWYSLWAATMFPFSIDLPRETMIVCATCRVRLVQWPEIDPLGYWFHPTADPRGSDATGHAPAPIEVFVDEWKDPADG